MKIKIKRLSALVLALALVFSFAACKNNGNGDEESTTNAVGETVAAGTEETNNSSDDENTASTDSSEPSTEENSTDAGSSEQKPVSNDTTSTQKGLNSTDIKKVVAFYKAAAKKTGSLDAEQTMSLSYIDCRPRNKAEAYFISAFEGIAKAALKANSVERTDVPGNDQALESSDITSANAVVSGNYTIVTLNVKTQEDNQHTKDSGIGPVGHAVGTLGDVTLALNEIPAVTVDYSQGSIILKYTNAKVVAKIDNNTGKIVSGTWAYTVTASLANLKVTFLGMDIDIVRMGGAVDFVVKTK